MTGNFFYIRPSGGFFCSLVLLFPRAAQLTLELKAQAHRQLFAKDLGLMNRPIQYGLLSVFALQYFLYIHIVGFTNPVTVIHIENQTYHTRQSVTDRKTTDNNTWSYNEFGLDIF